MSDIDIRAWWEGIAAASTGNILLGKGGNSVIAHVDCTGSGYKGSITFTNGVTVLITKVDMDGDKIVKIYGRKSTDDTDSYITCLYDSDPGYEDYLRKVGKVYIHDIEEFDLDDTPDTDPNLVPENIKAGVTIFGVTGTYTGG